MIHPLIVFLVFASSLLFSMIAGLNVLLTMSVTLASFGGIYLLNKPKRIILVYWLWVTLTPFLISTIFRVGILRRVDEALSAFMLAVLVAYLILTREKIPLPRWLMRFSTILIGITIFSALVNGSSPIGFVRFFLAYFRPFILVMMAVLFLSVRDIPKILILNSFIFAIQLLLNALWLLRISPIPTYKLYIDIATGTFESCAYTAYFSSAVAVYAISLANQYLGRNLFKTLVAVSVFGISLIQLYFTFTKHAYAFFGASTAILIFLNRKYLVWAGIASALLISVLLIGSQWEQQTMGVKSSADILKLDSAVRYFDAARYSPKGRGYERTMFNTPPEIDYPLLGAGPGRLGSFGAILSLQPLAYKYFGYSFFSNRAEAQIGRRSVIGSPYAGWLAIWTEIGPIAWLIYFSLPLACAYYFIRQIKRLKSVITDPYVVASLHAVVPCILFWSMLNLIDDASRSHMIGGLWIWVGLCFRVIHDASQKKKDSKKIPLQDQPGSVKSVAYKAREPLPHSFRF